MAAARIVSTAHTAAAAAAAAAVLLVVVTAALLGTASGAAYCPVFCTPPTAANGNACVCDPIAGAPLQLSGPPPIDGVYWPAGTPYWPAYMQNQPRPSMAVYPDVFNGYACPQGMVQTGPSLPAPGLLGGVPTCSTCGPGAGVTINPNNGRSVCAAITDPLLHKPLWGGLLFSGAAACSGGTTPVYGVVINADTLPTQFGCAAARPPHYYLNATLGAYVPCAFFQRSDWRIPAGGQTHHPSNASLCVSELVQADATPRVCVRTGPPAVPGDWAAAAAPTQCCAAGSIPMLTWGASNYYAWSAVLAQCAPCAPGSYAPAPSSLGWCLSCGPLEYAPLAGAGACLPCQPGWIANANRTACAPCPVNTRADAVSGTCVSCLASEYAPSASTVCAACPALHGCPTIAPGFSVSATYWQPVASSPSTYSFTVAPAVLYQVGAGGLQPLWAQVALYNPGPVRSVLLTATVEGFVSRSVMVTLPGPGLVAYVRVPYFYPADDGRYYPFNNTVLNADAPALPHDVPVAVFWTVASGTTGLRLPEATLWSAGGSLAYANGNVSAPYGHPFSSDAPFVSLALGLVSTSDAVDHAEAQPPAIAGTLGNLTYIEMEIRALQEAVALNGASIAGLTAQVIALGNVVSELAHRLDNVTAEEAAAASVAAQSATCCVTASTRITALNTSLSGTAGTVSGLANTVTALSTNVSGLTSSVSGLTAGVSGLTTSVSGLTTSVSGLTTSVSTGLSALGANVTSVNATLSGAVALLDAEVAALRVSNASAFSEIAAINGEIATLRASVVALSARADNLTVDVLRNTYALALLNVSIISETPVNLTGVTGALAVLSARTTTLEAGVSGLTGRVATAEGTLVTHTSQIASLTSASALYGTAITGLRTDVDGLLSSVASLASTVSGHTTALATLSADVSGVSTTVSGLTASVATLTATATGLSASVASLTSTTTGLSASVATLTSTTAGLSTSVAALTSTTTGLSASVATLTAATNGLTTTVTVLVTTTARNTANITVLLVTTAALEAQIRALNLTGGAPYVDVSAELAALSAAVAQNAAGLAGLLPRVGTVEARTLVLETVVGFLNLSGVPSGAAITNASARIIALELRTTVLETAAEALALNNSVAIIEARVDAALSEDARVSAGLRALDASNRSIYTTLSALAADLADLRTNISHITVQGSTGGGSGGGQAQIAPPPPPAAEAAPPQLSASVSDLERQVHSYTALMQASLIVGCLALMATVCSTAWVHIGRSESEAEYHLALSKAD